MKLESRQIWLVGKPTYEYARISDLMFSRSLGGILTGSAEVAPYYCVEVRRGVYGKVAFAVLVQKTETGYHLRAERKSRSPICYIEPGQEHDFPELVARGNAPDS